MTNNPAARRQRSHPAPNPSAEKEAEVLGAAPTPGAQTSYLKAHSEECGEPDGFQPDLTKAEA
jgi:hypothetical protein